jgi:hypothetical protein
MEPKSAHRSFDIPISKKGLYPIDMEAIVIFYNLNNYLANRA